MVRIYLTGVEGSSSFNPSIQAFHGLTLGKDNGRFYLMLDRPDDPIPTVAADMVEEITLKDAFSSLCPSRESGIYRFGAAEAEVRSGGMFIRGKNLEDVHELHRALLTGTIRPEVSYEGPQGGMSRAELEKELQTARDMIVITVNDLSEASGQRMELFHAKCVAENKHANLRRFANKLAKDLWPFCRKSSVVKAIQASLD